MFDWVLNTHLLNGTMSAKDACIFYHKDPKNFFSTKDRYLQYINKLFITNKFSLNVKKQDPQFFMPIFSLIMEKYKDYQP